MPKTVACKLVEKKMRRKLRWLSPQNKSYKQKDKV